MAHTSKTIIKVTTLKKRDKHDPIKLPNNKFRNKYHVSSTVNLEYTSRKDINTPAETIYNGANHTNIDMARSKISTQSRHLWKQRSKRSDMPIWTYNLKLKAA